MKTTTHRIDRSGKTIATWETGKGKTFDLTETLEKQNKELRKALEKCLRCLKMDSDMEEDFAPEIKQAEKAISQTTFENLVINPAGPKDEKVILKHTAGEWEREIDHSREAGNYPNTLIGCNGKLIAKCYNRKDFSISQQEAEANAKLISEAPALLHALKYMVETFKPHMAKMKISKNFSEFNAMAAAEKAIQKATT